MFEDFQQKGNKTAVMRSTCGLIGSIGFFIIFFFNVFGLEASAAESFTWPVLVLCAGAAIASVVNLIRAANVSLMNGVEKYCKNTDNPNATMERLKKVWNEGFDVGAGRIDPEYIILTLGMRSKVIPLGNALWAYKKVTRQQRGPVFSHLFVCYDNRKYHSASLKSDAIDAITGYIYKNCPNVAVGYAKELDKFYSQKDVQGFGKYAVAQRKGAGQFA